MDPNTTLDNIRAIIKEMHGPIGQGKANDLAYELNWLVRDLDEWLTGGGFPPAAWKHTT